MFTVILAALSNPTVDAGLLSAAESVIKYLAGLPEQRRAEVIAQVDAAAQSSAGQLAGFDADLSVTLAFIDNLALHPAVVASTGLTATVASLKAQVKAVAAPL